MTKTGRGVSEYQRNLESWILSAVEAGATSFQDILLSLPGVFPLDLVPALQRLKRSRHLSVGFLNENPVIKEKSTFRGSYQISLPIPHLLDYDWRFTDEAAERILQTSLRLTDSGDTLLFLGTPTVALRASNAADARVLRLVEWNPAVAAISGQLPNILVSHTDALREAGNEFAADVVVTDPPWYRDYLRSFAWTSALWCREGGHVLLSIPPIGTRPEMRDEHRALVKYCNSIGLERVQLIEGALPYVTPPFEINALRANGFDHVPQEWRRGDLWVMRRAGQSLGERPPRPAHDRWIDLHIGMMRLKIRKGSRSDLIDPRLVALIDGDICPSVSRRHPLRQDAQLWTSNNRVFGCKSPDLLAGIVSASTSGASVLRIVGQEVNRRLTDSEAKRVSAAADSLRRIAALEHDELLSFGHDYGVSRLARSAS